MKIKINIEGAGAVGEMNVGITRDALEQLTEKDKEEDIDLDVDEEESSGSNFIQAGREITINTNDVHATYKCNNTRFTINGNENKITLAGTCRELSIYGNDNDVTVNSKTDVIRVLGNDNSVSWSKKYNPVKPRIVNLGTDNVIRRIP